MRRQILKLLPCVAELVYEPFREWYHPAAAEVTERVCCGIELDPKYVDVIVQRKQTLRVVRRPRWRATDREFDGISGERRKEPSVK